MVNSSRQPDIFSYWVVKTYNTECGEFKDVFKSYGERVAFKEVAKYLARGVCAVVEYRKLPMN